MNLYLLMENSDCILLPEAASRLREWQSVDDKLTAAQATGDHSTLIPAFKDYSALGNEAGRDVGSICSSVYSGSGYICGFSTVILLSLFSFQDAESLVTATLPTYAMGVGFAAAARYSRVRWAGHYEPLIDKLRSRAARTIQAIARAGASKYCLPAGRV